MEIQHRIAYLCMKEQLLSQICKKREQRADRAREKGENEREELVGKSVYYI